MLVCFLLAEAKTLVALLGNSQLDTLSLGKTDPGLGAFTNDKDIRKTSGKGVVTAILKVDNIKTSRMTLTVSNSTNTTHIVSTGDHGNVSNLELDKGLDLSSFNVDTNAVVRANKGIGITDGATIMGDNEWDSLGSNLHLANLAKLILGFLIRDAVNNETSLDVIHKTELLTGLFNLNDIHETGREVGISANLTIDLNQALHNNAGNLTLIQGIFQTVTEENDQGKTLTKLVRTWRGTRGLHTIMSKIVIKLLLNLQKFQRAYPTSMI